MTLDDITVDGVGYWSLTISFLAADVGLLAAIASGPGSSRRWLAVAKWSVYALTAMLTVALMALLAALLDDNFHLSYVASYSEKRLPAGYKIAAIWAGQEGSLLLWAWMVAGMSSAVLAFRGRESVKNQAATTAILAGFVGLFCALILFTANPFKPVTGPDPVDGQEMSPLLQDPAMVLHPPALDRKSVV